MDMTPYEADAYEILTFEPHLHTLHSDGEDTVGAMFAACKSAGYDAVALTDHNTLSGLPEANESAAELGLVLVPGVEVTTFRGHAVVLGVSRVPEWRDLEQRGMDDLAREVHDEGGVLCVAHPAALGSPFCSGCAWEWPIHPASVDLWEIFGDSASETAVSLDLWRQLLRAGGSAAPVGRGDVHSTSAAAASRPITRLYARSRTPDGVLEALRRRRVVASLRPQLDFWLESAESDRTALVGERVDAADWLPRVSPSGSVIELRMADGGRCLYAELRDPTGALQAISAPIWIDSSH
jgi:hypothetical protein